MAYPVADEFGRTTAQPRFSDEVFDTLAERDAFASGLRYEGMLVYVKEDETSYRLKGGTDNVNWVVDGGGSGSGVVVVADIAARDAIPDDERSQGMIVYVEDIFQHYTISGDLTDDAYWRHLSAPMVFGEIGTPMTVVAVNGIQESNDAMSPYAKDQILFIAGDSAGENDISSVPQIGDGTFPGQTMTLVGCDNDDYVKLENGNNVELAALDPWYSFLGNKICLMWDGVNWSELWRRG